MGGRADKKSIGLLQVPFDELRTDETLQLDGHVHREWNDVVVKVHVKDEDDEIVQVGVLKQHKMFEETTRNPDNSSSIVKAYRVVARLGVQQVPVSLVNVNVSKRGYEACERDDDENEQKDDYELVQLSFDA